MKEQSQRRAWRYSVQWREETTTGPRSIRFFPFYWVLPLDTASPKFNLKRKLFDCFRYSLVSLLLFRAKLPCTPLTLTLTLSLCSPWMVDENSCLYLLFALPLILLSPKYSPKKAVLLWGVSSKLPQNCSCYSESPHYQIQCLI